MQKDLLLRSARKPSATSHRSQLNLKKNYISSEFRISMLTKRIVASKLKTVIHAFHPLSVKNNDY